MPLREHLQSSLFGKRLSSRALFGQAALATAALGGFFLFAGAPSAKADNCQRRIAHAEHELGEAIEDHGYYSRQADHWRYERHEAYEACGRYRVTKPTKRAGAIAAITGTGTATIATSAAITTVMMSTVTAIIAIMTASATIAAIAIGTETDSFSRTVLRRPGENPAS